MVGVWKEKVPLDLAILGDRSAIARDDQETDGDEVRFLRG